MPLLNRFMRKRAKDKGASHCQAGFPGVFSWLKGASSTRMRTRAKNGYRGKPRTSAENELNRMVWMIGRKPQNALAPSRDSGATPLRMTR